MTRRRVALVGTPTSANTKRHVEFQFGLSFLCADESIAVSVNVFTRSALVGVPTSDVVNM